ncbi:MAG: hypothetical protein ACJ76F_01780 [Bacteroidia bacterium]
MVEEEGTAAADLFRKSLYLYLVFNFVQLLPVLPDLYGQNSAIIPYNYSHFSLSKLVNLLSLPSCENLYYLFFAFQLVACVCGFLNILPRICAVVVWFTTINLNNRTYLMNTGGEQLLNIMLFYLMFISSSRKKRTELFTILDNTFIVACKMQLILVYALSALYKLLQPEWLNGNALFYVLHMDEFTSPFLRNISENRIVIMVLTYFSLLYQVLFPLLIFFKKLKKPLILCGIALHLGIAFGVGLMNFSLIMICCYLLFVNEEQAKRWNGKLSLRRD